METKRTDMYTTDVQNIEVVPGFNEREDYGDIKELAKNILENGILTPLKCKRNPDDKDKYFVVQGHRRLKACKLLLKENRVTELRVPFVLEGREVSEADRYVDMISGNEGKPLTILEQANVIGKLIKLGMEEKEIAKRLSKPVMFVRNCKDLLSAPEKIKKQIRENRISFTLVNELFREEKSFDKVIETIEEMDKTLGAHTGKKITKKDIDKKNNKVNSILVFKQMLRNNPDAVVKADKKREFDFVVRFISGKVSKKELKETFFERLKK